MFCFRVFCLFLLTFVAATACLAAELTPFERGIGLYNDKKYDEARKVWEEGEAAGDVDSVMALATHIYSAGRGAKQDDRKAFALYRKAARQGDAEAMNVVASCYFSGTGTAKDNDTGIEWERKSAEAGSVEAAASLGDRYAEGDLVKKDPVRAARWHKRAAEAGYHVSQLYMGKAYMNGRGVARNSGAAEEWLTKAAAQENDEAAGLLLEIAGEAKKQALPEEKISAGTTKNAKDADETRRVVRPTPEEERAAAREERAAAKAAQRAAEAEKAAKPMSEEERAAAREERGAAAEERAAAKKQARQSGVSSKDVDGENGADGALTQKKRDSFKNDGKNEKMVDGEPDRETPEQKSDAPS